MQTASYQPCWNEQSQELTTHNLSDQQSMVVFDANEAGKELPSLREACLQIANSLHAPMEAVESLYLYALSITAQQSHQLELPDGSFRTLSLPTLFASDNPSRDTHLLDSFLSAIEDRLQLQYLAYKKHLSTYNTELAVWSAEHTYRINAIHRSLSRNGGQARQEKQALREHLDSQPEKPRVPTMIYRNDSALEVLQSIKDGYPMAGWIISGYDADGHTELNTMKLCRQIWQQRPCTHQNSSGTYHHSIKPLISPLYVASTAALQSLVTQASTQANTWKESLFISLNVRYGTHDTTPTVSSSSALYCLQQRLITAVNNTKHALRPPANPPATLSLSEEAAEHWKQFEHKVCVSNLDSMNKHPGEHFRHKESLPLLAARLAALLTISESSDVTQIDIEAMQLGCHLAEFSEQCFGELRVGVIQATHNTQQRNPYQVVQGQPQWSTGGTYPYSYPHPNAVPPGGGFSMQNYNGRQGNL